MALGGSRFLHGEGTISIRLRRPSPILRALDAFTYVRDMIRSVLPGGELAMTLENRLLRWGRAHITAWISPGLCGRRTHRGRERGSLLFLSSGEERTLCAAVRFFGNRRHRSKVVRR